MASWIPLLCYVVTWPVPAGLARLALLWEEVFPAEQVRIVQLVFERIDIGTERFNIGSTLLALPRQRDAGDVE